MRHEADVDDDELMTWNDERGMGRRWRMMRTNSARITTTPSRVFGHRAASLHSV